MGESISDGTIFSASEAFTKTWTFRNDGYCDWNEDYQLVFKSGNQMSGPDDILFGIEVEKNRLQQLDPDLAPAAVGTYTGYWQLYTDDDVKFGSSLSVKIDVE